MINFIFFILTVIFIAYTISFTLFIRGRLNYKKFKDTTLSNFKIAHEQHKCKIDFVLNQTLTQQMFPIKYNGSISILEDKSILIHNIFNTPFLSLPEYKKPFILSMSSDLLNKSEEYSVYHTISINTNSFDNSVHIEAVHKRSNTSTITIRIPNLKSETITAIENTIR